MKSLVVAGKFRWFDGRRARVPRALPAAAWEDGGTRSRQTQRDRGRRRDPCFPDATHVVLLADGKEFSMRFSAAQSTRLKLGIELYIVRHRGFDGEERSCARGRDPFVSFHHASHNLAASLCRWSSQPGRPEDIARRNCITNKFVEASNFSGLVAGARFRTAISAA